MSLTTNVDNALIRVGTEFKALRVLISGTGTGDTSALETDATNLVDAINEVQDEIQQIVEAGTATNLDELTDVTLTSVAEGHILRRGGAGQWVNVLGTDYFDAAGAAAAAQAAAVAASQPLDTDLTAIAALSTTSYGRAFLELANQAALMGLLSAATTGASGIIELATQAEADTGTDAVRAITPATLAGRLANYQAAGSYQPLDSDLTALAALTTTAYGRGFLELADQAALMSLVSMATETTAGKVELATVAETTTGTDTARAVTPAGVAAAIAALVDSAPATLDTLNELAAALGDDPNFATSIATQIGGKQDSDATLTALAALTTAADQLIYATGADSFATTSLSAFARSLLDDTTAADARNTLSVYSKAEIGDINADFVQTFENSLT